MNKKHRKQVSRYSPVSTTIRRTGIPKKLIALFIVMILLVIGFFFIQTQINRINNAYQAIYQATEESANTQDTSVAVPEQFNILILGINYDSVENLVEEQAQIIEHLSVNNESKQSINISIPSYAYIENNNSGEDVLPLSQSYTIGGTLNTVNQVETLLDTHYDYVLTLRLSELRSLIEILGSIDVELSSSVNINNDHFPANELLTINGRQAALLLQRLEDDTIESYNQREKAIVHATFEAIFDKENILRLDEFLKASESVIQTNVPFNVASALYLGRYNDTLTHLEQLTLSGDTREAENGLLLQIDQEQLSTVQNLLENEYSQ